LARRTDGGEKSVVKRLSVIGVASFSAVAMSLAPEGARADDPAGPVCPSGYVWDQASARCLAREAGYPTPLRQTTQATYVPQSVAMSGPRVIKDWQEGDPVPDGYRVKQHARVGLVVGGTVTFGILYLFSVLGAAIVHDANNAVGGHDNADAFFIPGVGPFMEMTKTTSATGNVFNVIDGVGQCAGLAMLIVGLTSPKNVLVRNDLGKPLILPAPYIGQGSGGIGLVGRF
jgi:hypothetical protein